MAKYTIELRALNNPPFFKLFDFKYDFYEESKKEQFEQKFIDYFYMREIEHATAEEFKHELRTKLNLIAPYYKQLYETELKSKNIEFLLNKDLKETFIREVESDTEINSNFSNESTGKTKVETLSTNNDTPQNKIDDLDKYISSASKDKNSSDTLSEDNGESSTQNSNTAREETTLISQGNIGTTSSAQLLRDWRNVLINIDMMILEECEELFFKLF
ncbi:MAG: hypothetical protein SPF22_02630 [Candidatus Onthovivens sp.]|nr:hypothetical protein [Candidatus Onthovivens sp.]